MFRLECYIGVRDSNDWDKYMIVILPPAPKITPTQHVKTNRKYPAPLLVHVLVGSARRKTWH